MKTKTYTVMDFGEFDELVRKTYNQPEYEFAADSESPNDTEHATSTKERGLDKYDAERINDFIKTGKYCFLWRAIAQDMANKGLIPYGNLLVTVCW